MSPKRSKTTQSGRKAVRPAERTRRPTGRGKPAGEPREERRSGGGRRKEKGGDAADDESTRHAGPSLKQQMIEAAFALADATGAAKVLLSAEALGGDLELVTKRATDRQVILVAKGPVEELEDLSTRGPVKHIVRVPPVRLSRTGQIKLALVNALVTGAIRHDEKVVAISGPAALSTFDTLMVLDPAREMEMFAFDANPLLDKQTSPEVFEEFLTLAVEIGHQGREGKPVGAIFVIGDHEKVLQLSRQMIINPFKGYSDARCSIFNPEIRDTIREFAALDGAFVIREDGVVLAAGRLLSTTAADGVVPGGLGSRHAAGAGITTSTSALAITVSETDGSVRIFKGGRILTSINKPVV